MQRGEIDGGDAELAAERLEDLLFARQLEQDQRLAELVLAGVALLALTATFMRFMR